MRVFIGVEESISNGINVQGEEDGRETKHNGRQYYHDGDGDCPLSPSASMKTHEVSYHIYKSMKATHSR
jgi:hypothetical protein